MNPAEINLPSQSLLADAISEEKASALEQLSAAWQLQVTRIEEVLASGWRENIERVFEERYSNLTARIEEGFAAELDLRVAERLEAARMEEAERTEEALAAAREEGANEARTHTREETEAAVNAAREEAGRETEGAVAAARAEVRQELEAALQAAREDAARETECAVAAARAEARHELEAALQAAREGAAREAEAAVASAVSAAREQARREAAEELNGSVRRLRQHESREGWVAAVLEASTPFCRRAALFNVRGQTLEGAGARGWENGDAPRIAGAEAPLAQAPAFANAVSSRDTVISMRSAFELSESLLALLGGTAEQKAWLVPVLQHDRVAAVLYAEGDEVSGNLSGLETVSAVAGAVLAGRSAARAIPVVATTIGQKTGGSVASDWPALSSEEQDVHMKAQRFARVQVAEMRLYKSQAVKTGRASHNLYTVLNKEIDAARAAYEQQFMSTCQSMVDYLHQELVRTLANDDVSVLGQNYPGPLV